MSRLVLGLLADSGDAGQGPNTAGTAGGGGGARGVIEAVSTLLPVTARPPPRDAHTADPAAGALEQLRHVATALTGDEREMADVTVAKLRDGLLARIETRLAAL